MTNQKILLWLVILLFGLHWGIRFGTYGLFVDGVWYGCISRNWALSSDPNWWHLVVTPTVDASFGGHPPMAFWLQSLFFKVLGDLFWVEHLYSLFMATLSALAIYLVWQKVYADFATEKKQQSTGLLPIFLWLTMPIVGWVYHMNMLENTMTFFTTFAVYFFIPNKTKQYGCVSIILGTSLVILATLTKGPVGLFPLSVPIVYWILTRKERIFYPVAKTVFISLAVLLFYVFLIQFSPDAKAFLFRYINLQLLSSISGQDRITSRLDLIERIVLEPLIAIAITVLGWAFATKKKWHLYPINKTALFLYLSISFCAIAPMFISPKQLMWYIVPATPFLAMAVASLLLPIWYKTQEYIGDYKPVIRTIQLAVLGCFTVMISNWGTYGRNKEMLSDVFEMKSKIPPHTVVKISEAVYKQWNLHGYLYRFGYISLSTTADTSKYRLYTKEEKPQFESNNEQLTILNEYFLIEKRDKIRCPIFTVINNNLKLV